MTGKIYIAGLKKEKRKIVKRIGMQSYTQTHRDVQNVEEKASLNCSEKIMIIISVKCAIMRVIFRTISLRCMRWRMICCTRIQRKKREKCMINMIKKNRI